MSKPGLLDSLNLNRFSAPLLPNTPFRHELDLEAEARRFDHHLVDNLRACRFVSSFYVREIQIGTNITQ